MKRPIFVIVLTGCTGTNTNTGVATGKGLDGVIACNGSTGSTKSTTGKTLDGVIGEDLEELGPTEADRGRQAAV
jgi:hypothetical protein